MSKRTALVVVSVLAAVVLVVCLVVVLIGGEPVPPELARTRQAEQLLQAGEPITEALIAECEASVGSS